MVVALACLDDFLINPLIQGHSGTAPKMSRNTLRTIQGTIERDSQNDPHPKAGIFKNQTTQNSGLEDGHNNMATRATEQIGDDLDRNLEDSNSSL